MSDIESINQALVFEGSDGEPFTTSLVIATQTGNQHESVVRVVRDNLADLEEFGRVRFEIGPLQTAGGVQKCTWAVLTEPQSALLITFLRNNEKVIDFKKRLVRDFYLMRQALAAPNVRFIVPKTMSAALRMAADEFDRAELAEQQNRMLEARIEKDAPLVAKAEAHSNADNAAVNRQTFAREVQQWGIGRGINVLHEHVYELLRRKGMLVAGERSDRNHATAHATKSGWAWTKKDVKNDHATATTYIRPRGQDLAWKWITDYVAAYGDLSPRGVA